MSIIEDIISRKINSESEGVILIRTQKNRSIVFITFILLLSLVAFWRNVESEAAPYLFALFCTWILHHLIYYVLLLNNDTNKKLEDVELYAENLRAYSVENIDKLTESCSKFDLSLKKGESTAPPNENIYHAKRSESAMTKEINTLLKILLGVAITSYKYDPKSPKNPATAEIVNDLALAGISIDPGTVLKHLKAAAQVIKREIPEK